MGQLASFSSLRVPMAAWECVDNNTHSNAKYLEVFQSKPKASATSRKKTENQRMWLNYRLSLCTCLLSMLLAQFGYLELLKMTEEYNF